MRPGPRAVLWNNEVDTRIAWEDRQHDLLTAKLAEQAAWRRYVAAEQDLRKFDDSSAVDPQGTAR